MLKAKNIHKSYGQLQILKGVDLEVQKGEKIFLFGPSGSGKTTLLEILAGVLVPQKGSVKVAGTDLVGLSGAARDRFRREKMGYIFQNFNLIPYLSVAENILLPLQLQKNKKNNDQLSELTNALGISQLLNSPVTEISMGQQQRVAVARALLGSPELLLADEPTSALDFESRERFLQLMFDLCKKRQTTVIFVSHDRSLKELFDRQIALSEINSVMPLVGTGESL